MDLIILDTEVVNDTSVKRCPRGPHAAVSGLGLLRGPAVSYAAGSDLLAGSLQGPGAAHQIPVLGRAAVLTVLEVVHDSASGSTFLRLARRADRTRSNSLRPP